MMMDIVKLIVIAGISYLIGAIPTAFIFGKLLKGIDIRQHGSGNVGATNTFRVLGKGPGIFVLIFDILKGVLAVTLVSDFFKVDVLFLLILLGLTSIIGHNWTVFLRFKGGKGIATSLGVFLGLTIKLPTLGPVLLGTVAVWLVIFLIFGFVSLASLVAAAAFPILSASTHQPIEIIGLGVVCCLFVTLRHRANINRLLAGQERRVRIFPSSNKSS